MIILSFHNIFFVSHINKQTYKIDNIFANAQMNFDTNELSENLENEYFILTYKGSSNKIFFKDYIRKSENFVIQAKNQKWGHDGNRKQAILSISQIVKMGFSYQDAFKFVYSGLTDKINSIVDKINIEPKDSAIKFMPNFSNKFSISTEKIGYSVDSEKLYKDIYDNCICDSKHTVEIYASTMYPKITKEDNQKSTKLLSTFSTDISKSSNERKNNVKRALQSFNGMVVESGQTVSFNKTTGRRTEKNGYKSAHIILNEVFVDGVGGGVCQSSTTLYNALLMADNVSILQSSRHSMPVSYVQLGFDAMVSYGTSDLVFKNEGDTPIFIHTYCKNDKVYAEIYGKPNNNYTKKRRTEVIKTLEAKNDKTVIDTEGKYLDKVKYKGEKYRLKHASNGYEVKTYLDLYDGNTLVSSKLLRHTTYPAQEGIIIEGNIEKEE